MRDEAASTEPAASDSDVDIGVRPDPGRRMHVDEIVHLATELERLLGARRVDVVLLPTAAPFLALEVIRGELLSPASVGRSRRFYDEVAEEELYEICTGRLSDVERVLAGLHRWIRKREEGEDEEERV